MFAALALFRAPYMVALGSVPQLTLRVTRHSVAGEHAALRSLTRGLAALTAVAARRWPVCSARCSGPAVLQTRLRGHGRHLSGLAAVLATGCTLAVANLALMVSGAGAEPPARRWPPPGAWPSSSAPALSVALTSRSPAGAASGGFLVAEVAATAALAFVAVRSLRRSDVSRA